MVKLNEELWIVEHDEGNVYENNEGYWKGGSGVWIPAYTKREDAIVLRKKIKKEWKGKLYEPRYLKTSKIKVIK